MPFDPISYYLAKRSITWKLVKEKMRDEGALNKEYDRNLNGEIDLTSISYILRAMLYDLL